MKNEPEGTGSKADDAEGKKADEEDGAPKAEVQDGDAPKQEADAEAYEADLLPENELLPDEGNVGTYKELIDNGSKGDNITPHHMPSDAFMSKNNVEGYTRNEGISMNMEQPHPGTGGRHRQTSTYDNNMTKAEQQAYWDLSPREALARDIMDARKIYQEQGLYTPEIRQSLQDVINQNKLKYPQVFNK